MKKAATSAAIGRSARAGEAARVRRVARATKASRAAQAAVVTALGAGLLLHGGPASAATATSVPGYHVVVTGGGDEPGSEGGSGRESTALSGDSGSGDSGVVDSGAGDSGSGGAASDGSGEPESSEVSSEGSGSDGSESGGAGADGAASGTSEPQATDPAGSGDTPSGSGTAPAEPATALAPAPPQIRQVPSSAPVTREAVDPAPSPRTATAPIPTAPLVPDVAALVREARSGARAAGSSATGGIGRAVVVPATVPSSMPTSGRAPAARVSEAVAQNPITRLVLALVGVGQGGVIGAPTPAVPTTALLVAQWALFRRGENPLFNRSPVAPGLTGAPTTGRVEGSDPDGDRLTYALLDGPDRGKVAVAPDGTYVYTPDADLARDGGTATFTVLVRDNDPAAPGLGGFTDVVRTAISRSNPALAERLFGAHTTVATVTVQVEGTDSGTPVPAVVVNPTTGVVTGQVGPNDGVPRAYTVTVAPQSGTLTVDDLGHYVYTPSDAARRAAALTAGADVDSFTVVVTDRDTGVAAARSFALFAAGSGTTHTVTLPISEVVTGERYPVGGYPSGLVPSPDGRYVAVRSYGDDDAVTVIDTLDGSIYRVPVPGAVGGFAFSGDGSRLVVVGDDASGSTVTVVSTADDAAVHQSRPSDGAGDARLSADGRYVYLARADTPPTTTLGNPGPPGFPPFPGIPVPGVPGRLAVIDTQDGSLRQLAVGNFGGVQQSPDGTRAYAVDQDSGRVVVVGTASATVVDTVPAGTGASQVAFSPDGSRGYVVDGAGRMTVIRVADDTSASLGSIPGADPYLEDDFSPDGRYLLVPDYLGNQVTVIDVQGDRVVGTVAAGAPSEIAYSPDGRLAYVGNRWDGPGIVTAIDLAGGTGTPITVGNGFRDTAFSLDGARAYVTAYDGTVSVVDTATSAVVGTIAVPEGSYALTLSPDGTRAYVTSTNEPGEGTDETGDLTVIDLATGDTTVIEVGDRPGAAVVSPDGRRVYVDNYYSSSVTVIDAASNTVIGVVEGSTSPYAALTPDGRFVYAVDLSQGTGGVILISTADDTVTFVPASNISVFGSVRFSPDGRRLFVESDDGQLVAVDLDAVGSGADGDAVAA